MIKHLKSKQEYIDLYDKFTVDSCRNTERICRSIKPPEKVTQAQNEALTNLVLHYELLFKTMHWYENKEKTISEWMTRDEKKDRLYESEKAPTDIRCNICHYLVTPEDKIFYDGFDDKEDRILFMYKCSNGCKPKRAFFNTGEEYVIKPSLCSTCETILERTHERIDDKKIVTTDTCPKCGHAEIDEIDLSTEEKPEDPEYENDRSRFCLSGEALFKNQKEKANIEGLAKIMKDIEEKDKHKEEYQAVKELKKLTIVSLENLLLPLFEKSKYVKFQMGAPELGRDLIVPFTIYDSQSDRIEYDSIKDLKRLFKQSLEDTNWRLMSDGISYRMGILTGRLRAYEREEDLLKLVGKNR